MISAIFEEAYQAKDPVLEAFTKTYCFKNDDLLEDLCLEMSEKATLESDSEAYLDSFADYLLLPELRGKSIGLSD
jgi:hypothetical protein